MHAEISPRVLHFSALHFNRIDGNDVIKVSDFGLTEEMYDSNYYHYHIRGDTAGTGKKVLIRWMAPECIKTRVY